MATSKLPSVNETFFQHKVLTKIVGLPTYSSLKILQDELKANSSSVPSILGGGFYGHLGLILSPDKYATLPNSVPWVPPPAPGPFLPPAGATGPQIEAAKDVWRASQSCFNMFQATSKALIAQVVESIDSIYLRALLNRLTGQYANNLHEVLHHLFSTYGNITPQQVEAQKAVIYNMPYSISSPVDVVFNAIDDLVDVAEHGNAPISSLQMMDLAYVLLSKERAFQQDIRAWTKLPANSKTWPNMVTYFRSAQTDLNSFPTAGDLYHTNHANAAIMADLVAQRLLAALPSDVDTSFPSDDVPPPANANAVLQSREAALVTRESALLNQMSDLMALMRNGHHGGANNNNNRNNNANRNNRSNSCRGNRSDTNTDRPNGAHTRTPLPRQYCWSHGYCAHASSQCNNQLPGHQATATTTNMQGGSTNNCFWVTSA